MKSSSLQFSSQPFSRHDARPAAVLRNFPQTDYDYQATTEAPVSAPSAEPLVHAAQMRSFRLLSKQAVSSRRWESALEATVFSLVVGLVAWPLVSLLIVLAQTARG